MALRTSTKCVLFLCLLACTEFARLSSARNLQAVTDEKLIKDVKAAFPAGSVDADKVSANAGRLTGALSSFSGATSGVAAASQATGFDASRILALAGGVLTLGVALVESAPGILSGADAGMLPAGVPLPGAAGGLRLQSLLGLLTGLDSVLPGLGNLGALLEGLLPGSSGGSGLGGSSGLGGGSTNLAEQLPLPQPVAIALENLNVASGDLATILNSVLDINNLSETLAVLLGGMVNIVSGLLGGALKGGGNAGLVGGLVNGDLLKTLTGALGGDQNSGNPLTIVTGLVNSIGPQPAVFIPQSRIYASDGSTRSCGWTRPSLAQGAAMQKELDAFELEDNIGGRRLLAGPITIQTHVHIGFNPNAMKPVGPKDGNLTYATIKSQIDRLNKDFGAYGQFQFRLVDVTRRPTPAWGTDPRENEGLSLERFLQNTHVGDASVLNIWVTKLSNGILGFAQGPISEVAGSNTDGVCLSTGTLPGGLGLGLGSECCQDGATATHEVGHWLGLGHTFDGDCDIADPDDYCQDTPKQTIHEGCPNEDNPSAAPVDTCAADSGADSPDNYMDYQDDRCLKNFTPEQRKRMMKTFNRYRMKGGRTNPGSGGQTTTKSTESSAQTSQPMPFAGLIGGILG